MSSDNECFASEVEAGIAGYLRQVERNLRESGRSSEETEGILADLNCQIRGQLSDKAGVSELNSVLARMDPPHIYAVSHSTPPASQQVCASRTSPALKTAVVFVLIVIGAFIVYYALVDARMTARQKPTASSLASTPASSRSDATPSESSHATALAEKTVAVEKTAVTGDQARIQSPLIPPTAAPVGVAVVRFTTSESIREENALTMSVADGLVNTLAAQDGIRVVEREKLAASLGELKLSAEGMVDSATAIKLGRLTGARVIVTGNIVKLGDQTIITARLINSETAELAAVKVSGDSTKMTALVDELGNRIAERICKDEGGRLTARAEDTEAARVRAKQAEIRKAIAGGKIPRVLVMIPETHLSLPVRDPAAETELVSWMTECGFPVASPEYEGVEKPRPISDTSSDAEITFHRNRGWRNEEGAISVSSRLIHQCITGGLGAERDKLAKFADIVLIGEGISERGTTREGLVSCKARIEVKAVDVRTGEVLMADSTYGAGVDVAERIAGKRALQAAGREMAEKLLPALVKKWQRLGNT